ncbi:MAG TPA: serine hydrolase domain-containing protein, partial [Thermoanaerobaculia bacterium]|nr:serine hydrolase domain-containing protein [Thermoanaerobaculia bacterium]
MRLSITLALFALALDAHAAPFAHLRRQIVAEVEQRNVPAFAVAVVQGNRIIWEEGFGDGVTARTPFALASVSKPITATALMVLAERGKIDLDQPIDHYLGGVRVVGRDGDPAQATVRRVASHTAGLPPHHRFFTAGTPDFEQTAARYAMVVRPPGTAYQYSNLGYRLIERALETVTGEPLGDVLRREVFAPLGMDDASFPADPPYRSDHPGGSDIYASAHDLARFAAFHLGALMPGQQEILSRRARDLMHRPHTPRGDDEPHDYGIGWIIEENVIGHTGGMPGVRAAIYLMPARKVAVITLAACETDLTERIARQVLARYDRSPRAKHTTPAMGKRSPRRLRGAWSGTVDVAGAE